MAVLQLDVHLSSLSGIVVSSPHEHLHTHTYTLTQKEGKMRQIEERNYSRKDRQEKWEETAGSQPPCCDLGHSPDQQLRQKYTHADSDKVCVCFFSRKSLQSASDFSASLCFDCCEGNNCTSVFEKSLFVVNNSTSVEEKKIHCVAPEANMAIIDFWTRFFLRAPSLRNLSDREHYFV